jgi:hypothetical protein
MPLIQIDLDQNLYTQKHEQISREIHQAQIDAWGVPTTDLFQVFRPHATGEMKFDRTHRGVDRQNFLLIRITMVHKYSGLQKKRLYAEIVRRLGSIGIRSEDILISLIENGFEDWYAGDRDSLPDEGK